MKKLLYCILLFLSQSAYSQYLIKGKILSSKTNAPIAGASLFLGNAALSSQSSSSGEFSIFLNAGNYTLKVRHLGYLDKEIRFSVPHPDELLILLTDSVNQLEEVNIRTGYQEIPKDRATGSFTQIDNKTLNEQSGTNILARLNGVTSGLAFDTKSSGSPQRQLNFNIRGLSSINGPLDPLIVLDNFPYEGKFENINPNDVESITILKDAAAASIWGARAGNGVVVITTKKGRLNQKTSIAFGSTFIISDKSDLFKLPEMSSADYIDVEQMLFGKGFFNSTITNQPYAALTPAVEVFLARRNKLISAADSAQQINALKQIDSRRDYTDYVLQNPLIQQYFLNVTGGTDRSAYTLSAAFDRSVSETASTLNKLNLRAGNMYKITKSLSVDFNLYYTNSKSGNGKPGWDIRIASRKVPYIDFVDDNGKPLPVAVAYNKRYTSTAGNGKLLNWDFIPLEDYKYTTNNNLTKDLVANFSVRQNITKWLSLNGYYQYEWQQAGQRVLQSIDAYAVRNTINTFTQINGTTGAVTYIVPKGGILERINNSTLSNKARAQLNINKDWHRDNLSGIIGAELSSTALEASSATLYGYQENPLSISSVDFVNSYPSFITGGNQRISGSSSLSQKTNRYISTYGNFAYTYAAKYTLSASARRDASNVFGQNTNDRWKPLWSAGASWKISDETFYKVDWLPVLKLRVSYGYQGNVDITRSALTIMQYGTLSRESGLQQASISQISNPELRWEKTGQLNLALDFSAFNNRLSGSIDYYRKHGKDLYGPVAYDYTAWGPTSTITKNAANMIGDGLDLNVQSQNLTGRFNWTTRLLVNYNSNKVSKYFQPVYYNIQLINGGSTLTPAVGYPLYGIASYKWAGLDAAGNPQGYLKGQKSTDYNAIMQDANTNGLASESMVYQGRTIPNFTGALINDFTSFGFTLSLNINYRFGYYFRSSGISYSTLYASGMGHAEFADRWQNPGDELHTDVPSLVYPANGNRDTFYFKASNKVDKGDHIRLQYISLAHNLPLSLLNKMGLKSLRIFSNISNLGILWRANKKGLDPEYPNALPPVKAYTIGLSARL